MENENKPQGQQLQVEVAPDVAAGVYSNFALIAHTKTEFVVDMASMMPGVPLAMALQENIMRYEKQFGRIELPNQQPRTVAPFNIGKGEA